MVWYKICVNEPLQPRLEWDAILLYYVDIHFEASDDAGFTELFSQLFYHETSQKNRSFGHVWKFPLWKYDV